MKRQLVMLVALSLSVLFTMAGSAAAGGHGDRGGHNSAHGQVRGFGHGFGRGFGTGGIGFGGGYDCGWDIAELYRELYHNLPYFALHPPVYYSCPVPRTYGYSPFAYPPGTMTPDVIGESQPVTINNPYVPATTPVKANVNSPDRSASTSQAPEPLV